MGSFQQPHVRRFAKERLVDALGCAAVDSFFYLTLDNTQQRDDLLPAPNATVEAAHAAAREFDPVSVTLHVRDDSLGCLLYTSPSPRDKRQSRMPSSA